MHGRRGVELRGRTGLTGLLVWCRWRALACAGVMILAASSFGDDDWKRALEKPLSPGPLALLVAHGRDAPARDRMSQGLRDPRAEVRATSARVITIAAVGALADDSGKAAGLPTRLHFEIYEGDRAINPYPVLASAEPVVGPVRLASRGRSSGRGR